MMLTTTYAEYKDKEVITPAIIVNQRQQRKAQQALTQDDSLNDYKTGASKVGWRLGFAHTLTRASKKNTLSSSR